jgi:hypothetical protein
MLTGITTRTSTPQEDAEPWPGGSARPVLDYLTGTLGMTGAGARELLKAARTAQAEAGPGALADYPVPGGDAHLLIHYAPGSRAYRFKLSAPDAAPGILAGPDGPSRGRETPHGSPGRRRRQRARPLAARPAGRGGRAGAGKDHGHYLAQRRPRCAGQAHRDAGRLPARRPRGRRLHLPGRPRRADGGADRRRGVRHLQRPPQGPDGADLACAYYGRRLRSLSVGDVVVIGEVALAVGRPAGWEPVSGSVNEVRTCEHGTRPLPVSAEPGEPCPNPPRRSTAMTVLEGPQYQAARDRIKGNPVISMMAAGIAAVPLAQIAHEDGTPASSSCSRPTEPSMTPRRATRAIPVTSRTRRAPRGTCGWSPRRSSPSARRSARQSAPRWPRPAPARSPPR